MNINNIKAGYQNRPDSMRSLADESFNKMSSADDVAKMKKGGCVEKFAAGGVAKIRHKQSTSAGKPKSLPKKV